MINWQNLNNGGFQNALATGLQLGGIARQNQQQDELMKQRQQQFDLQQQAAQQEAANKAAEGDLTARALKGDATALDELATVNFDRWKSLNAEVKAKAKQDAEMFGGAAIDILQVPYAQRQGRIVQYAQQFPQFRRQIEELAYLPEAEQDAKLRGVVVEAQMVDRLHSMEQPSYQRVAPGEVLVNTRDPGAVSRFAAPGQGGFTEGQTATNPQTGQRIVFRNGAWSPM